MDDGDIMQHRRMAALTLLMKHIRQRDLMELLDTLPQVMVEWISPDQVRVLINYMVNAGDSPSPEFMRALAERLPRHEDDLMTIAERLEQKGIAKGIEQGIMLGEHQGLEKVARNMLADGMGIALVMRLTGLSEEQLRKITH
ncbi:transposase [Escherichia coli M056]|nr:transposase [Escherichia coli M056]